MTSLIDSAREILHARDTVNDLMNKCEQISLKLETLVSKIINKNSVDLDMETSSMKIKSQPKLLNPEYMEFLYLKRRF